MERHSFTLGNLAGPTSVTSARLQFQRDRRCVAVEARRLITPTKGRGLRRFGHQQDSGRVPRHETPYAGVNKFLERLQESANNHVGGSMV